MIRQYELPHRGLKDFGFEELPFKRFAPNSVVYYCMLTSFFLLDTYKKNISNKVIPTSPIKPFWQVGSYATTVRRKVLDFAVKMIKTKREISLKVTKELMDNLRFVLKTLAVGLIPYSFA